MNNSRRQSKTKLVIFRLRHVVIALSAIFFSYTLSFAMSGSGTAGDPFVVTNYADLEAIGTGGYTLASVYRLANDIDASASAAENAGAGFVPIGGSVTQFSGTFHGAGHVVNNLHINRSATDFVGLFGYTTPATIDSLGVTNAAITGNNYVGGVVGYISGSHITSCYVTGIVSGTFQLGGIAGYNGGTITNCYMSGTVTNSGSFETGGIAGFNYLTITKCYMSGSVTSTSSSVGGIAGVSEGIITNCYEVGSVHGTFQIGGVVGYNYGPQITMSQCYAAGSVTGTVNNIGGVVGLGTGIVDSCYWDKQTTTQTTSYNSDPSYGKLTTEMKTQSTFVGWSSTIWNMGNGINNGYPYLKWQNPGGTPLPVELTSFVVTSSNSTATLAWKTATEVNNYGFEIERRQTAQRVELSTDWAKAGFVAGAGTSNSPRNYSYTDKNLSPGKYVYRLKQVDDNGAFSYGSSVEVEIGSAPQVFALLQNYPNPFNPSTEIGYSLEKAGMVSLKVYNMLGQEVATLVNGPQEAGSYTVPFGINKGTLGLSSGVYIYRLEAGSFISTKKLVLMK